MRIAQVAPLYESVPPKLYGGTERVVSFLTEELVRQGHEVTLYASGDSVTRAQLVPCSERALRQEAYGDHPLAHHVLMLERLFQEIDQFDVCHFHIDYLHFPLSRRHAPANVTTLHGRLDLPDIVPIFREFRDAPLVSISDAQRAPLAWADWRATIYHGLPLDLLRPHLSAGRYLAFLGRISPEKRVDRAIEIAIRAGLPLKIAAKVDPSDEEYYAETIRPLLDHPLIEFVGEIGEEEKDAFLGDALALLFPIDWPEPFGLVMIEAMACGTPVIAFRRGSVPEIIDDGLTGFVVGDVDEAVAAIERLSEIDRRLCRRIFEQRFSVSRMTQEYVSVYERLATAAPVWQFPSARAGSRAFRAS